MEMEDQKELRRKRRNVRPELRLLESFMLIAAAFTVLLATFVPSFVVGLLAYITSCGLIVVGLIDLAMGMRYLERLNHFREDHRGIVSIWIVCFISLGVYSILWFTLGWATFKIIDIMTSSFSYPPPAMLTINLMELVLRWHPILFFFGMLLWAFNMSQKGEETTVPMGYM
jgi:hypothetical protein